MLGLPRGRLWILGAWAVLLLGAGGVLARLDWGIELPGLGAREVPSKSIPALPESPPVPDPPYRKATSPSVQKTEPSQSELYLQNKRQEMKSALDLLNPQPILQRLSELKAERERAISEKNELTQTAQSTNDQLFATLTSQAQLVEQQTQELMYRRGVLEGELKAAQLLEFVHPESAPLKPASIAEELKSLEAALFQLRQTQVQIYDTLSRLTAGLEVPNTPARSRVNDLQQYIAFLDQEIKLLSNERQRLDETRRAILTEIEAIR